MSTSLPPLVPAQPLLGSGPEALRDPLGLYGRAFCAFGEVVRFRGLPGVQWYALFHPAAAERVLGSNRSNYRAPLDLAGAAVARSGPAPLLQRSEAWEECLAAVEPVFQPERLAPVVPALAAAAEELGDRWAESARIGEAVDVAAAMSELALRGAGSALFSNELSAAGDRLGDVVREVTAHEEARAVSAAAPEWVPSRGSVRALRARGVLDALIDDQVRQRRGRSQAPGDLLTALVRARDPTSGARLGDRGAREVAAAALLASQQWVSSWLAWTWYLLSQNPEALSVLQAEMEQVLGGSAPAPESLPRLAYTGAVLDEAVRLYPAAWMVPREAVEEDEIAGYRIPARSLVVVCPWVAHRRADLWEDPSRFDPGRFLGDRAARIPPYAYLPFGAGIPRAVGAGLARTQALVALATLAQRFDLVMVPGQAVRPEAALALRPLGGLRMTAHQRLAAAAGTRGAVIPFPSRGPESLRPRAGTHL